MSKPFTKQERKIIKSLCYRCKKGDLIRDTDQAFMQEMYTQNPDEYKEIQGAAADKAIAELKALGGTL